MSTTRAERWGAAREVLEQEVIIYARRYLASAAAMDREYLKSSLRKLDAHMLSNPMTAARLNEDG